MPVAITHWSPQTPRAFWIRHWAIRYPRPWPRNSLFTFKPSRKAKGRISPLNCTLPNRTVPIPTRPSMPSHSTTTPKVCNSVPKQIAWYESTRKRVVRSPSNSEISWLTAGASDGSMARRLYVGSTINIPYSYELSASSIACSIDKDCPSNQAE